MATTMCNNHSTLKYFWAEAINTAYYLQNKYMANLKEDSLWIVEGT